MDRVGKTMLASAIPFVSGLIILFFLKRFVFIEEKFFFTESFFLGFLFFQFEVCMVILAVGTLFSMKGAVFFNRKGLLNFFLVFILFFLKISAILFFLPFLIKTTSPLLLGCGALFSLFFSLKVFSLFFFRARKTPFCR